MREEEGKRYQTDFGRVTDEDYKNSRRGTSSFVAPVSQQPDGKWKKITWKEFKKGVKTTLFNLFFPDGSTWKYSSEHGLKRFKPHFFGNPVIAVCIVFLVLVGVIMIMSSSYYTSYCENKGDAFVYIRLHVRNLAIGIIPFLFGRLVPLRLYQKISFFLYLISTGLCILVLFVGVEKNGSVRWLDLGFVEFQPSELAKLGVAIYMSALVERYHDTIKSPWTYILLLFVLGFPVLLIAKENLSTGIIVFMIGIVIMIAGGVKSKHLIRTFLPLVVAGCLIMIWPAVEEGIDFANTPLLEWGYRMRRIKTWLYPETDPSGDGYQLLHSLYAIASGGFWGRGLGESIQKLGFLPYAFNDIIFSVLCEELGVVGAGVVILLYGVFGYQGYSSAEKTKNIFASCLISGITTQVVLQALINIGVSTGMLPVTGASLPFISYGGSSVFILMAGIGLMINATRFSGCKEKESAKE